MAILLLPASSSGEIVAFTGGNYTGWETWRWSSITHLAFWTPPTQGIRDMADKHRVRLYIDAGLPDKSTWTNDTARTEFAMAMVKKVQQHQTSGVFFDFEGNTLSKEEKAAYALLAKAVTSYLKPLNASIFICVGGRPTYEFRNYPYADLANASEFLFIMGYDMHFWDDYTCVVKGTCSPAEASIKDLSLGLHSYIQLVPPEKLVLGLPWYGQRYNKVIVPINEGQINYASVLQAFDTPGLVTEKRYDNSSQSWVVTCKSACDQSNPSNKGDIVWYDDAISLAPKYALARNNNLLGVGMWSVEKLPLPGIGGEDPHKVERNAMWDAISSWEGQGVLLAGG